MLLKFQSVLVTTVKFADITLLRNKGWEFEQLA